MDKIKYIISTIFLSYNFCVSQKKRKSKFISKSMGQSIFFQSHLGQNYQIVQDFLQKQKKMDQNWQKPLLAQEFLITSKKGSRQPIELKIKICLMSKVKTLIQYNSIKLYGLTQSITSIFNLVLISVSVFCKQFAIILISIIKLSIIKLSIIFKQKMKQLVKRNIQVSRDFNSKKITVKIDQHHKKILNVQILDNKSGNKYGQNYTYETLGKEITNLFPNIEDFYNKLYDQIENEGQALTLEDDGFVKLCYIDRDKGLEPARHVLILRTKLKEWKQTTNVKQAIQLIFSHLAKLQKQHQQKQKINLQRIEKNLPKLQMLNQLRQKINPQSNWGIQQNVAKTQVQHQSRQQIILQTIKGIEQNLFKLQMKILSIQKIAQLRNKSIQQNLAKLQLRNQSSQKINQQRMKTIEQNLTKLQSHNQKKQKINLKRKKSIEKKMQEIEDTTSDFQQKINKNETKVDHVIRLLDKMITQREQIISKVQSVQNDLRNKIKDQQTKKDLPTQIIRQTEDKIKRQNKCLQQFQTKKKEYQKCIDYTIQSIVSTPATKVQKPKINDMNFKIISDRKANLIKITPDTNTYAWKQNKYRQDNANKNVCIYQDNGDGYSQWLCSSDWCDGECVFTIKVHRVNKQYSAIRIGVMDSQKKGEKLGTCVYLSLGGQKIYRPNQKQTGLEEIECSCQQSLTSLPCLIECYVNRNQNTITWHYNGKHQAESAMPNSWKDQRKLCAVVMLFGQNNCVEFM